MRSRPKIGNLFDKSYELDLIPGRILNPSQLYLVEISFHTFKDPYSEEISSSTFYATGDEIIVTVGNDVHTITYSIRGRNSKNQIADWLFSLRLDKLIMLNLANKFFNLKVPL